MVESSLAKSPCIVEAAEEKSDTPKRHIGRAETFDDSLATLRSVSSVPSRNRVSASLASPRCASAKADEATV